MHSITYNLGQVKTTIILNFQENKLLVGVMFLPALLRTGLGDVLECEFLLGKEEDGGYPWLTIKNKIQL